MTLICFVKVREKRRRWYRLMCRENSDIPFIADSSMEFRIGVAMPVIHRHHHPSDIFIKQGTNNTAGF